MPTRRWGSWIGILGASILLALGAWGGTVAAQQGLRIGGSSSNFGRHSLRGGFVPDPFTVSITSGGSIDARALRLGANCGGFVTREPDFILNYDSPSDFLRIYFQGNGDTTLVINDPAGGWHCNDDSFGGLNPSVDFNRPRAGQYDIWVGSYSASENVRGTLHVTELRNQHP